MTIVQVLLVLSISLWRSWKGRRAKLGVGSREWLNGRRKPRSNKQFLAIAGPRFDILLQTFEKPVGRCWRLWIYRVPTNGSALRASSQGSYHRLPGTILNDLPNHPQLTPLHDIELWRVASQARPTIMDVTQFHQLPLINPQAACLSKGSMIPTLAATPSCLLPLLSFASSTPVLRPSL